MEQLTLFEYEQSKQAIKGHLLGMAKSFVRIGYELDRIDRSKAYEKDGYKSVAEFAKAEYDMNPDGVSRFIRIYREYALPGENPELKEEYRDFKFSQLQEMLQLPESDRRMITPETKREDIRELTRFNKTEHTDILDWQQDPEERIKECIGEFFEQNPEISKDVAEGPYPPESEKDELELARIILKHTKKYRGENVFLMFYISTVMAKVSDGEPVDVSWKRFWEMCHEYDAGIAPAQELKEGPLHGKKFKTCIHIPEEECIAEDCQQCKKYKRYMEEEQIPGQDSIEEHEEWMPKPELKKPDEREKEYLADLARHLIYALHDWFLADYTNRVMLVDKSPEELKKKLGHDQRTKYFSVKNGVAHANLFDGYVQIWDEKNICLGDYDWFYLAAAIQSMWNEVALEKAQKEIAPAQNQLQKEQETEENAAEIAATFEAWPDILSDIPVPPIIAIKNMLATEEKNLEEYRTVEGLPENVILRQEMITAGLRIIRNLVEDCMEEEPQEQPPLPVMRNNDQRKEWIRNYKDWGLWHENSHIGAKYYKYDFGNGARLIAEVYENPETEWHGAYESNYLHLIGGPEADEKQGIPKWTRHEKYSKYPNSETEIVEFLKFIQKENKHVTGNECKRSNETVYRG